MQFLHGFIGGQPSSRFMTARGGRLPTLASSTTVLSVASERIWPGVRPKRTLLEFWHRYWFVLELGTTARRHGHHGRPTLSPRISHHYPRTKWQLFNYMRATLIILYALAALA